MIHELLHHNILIHKTDWKKENIKRLKEHFNIHNNMLLIPNEAIIETFACVLNSIFYSIESGSSLQDNLKKDQVHSINLAKKIGNAIMPKMHNKYMYLPFIILDKLLW
jgi:stalled ribosome rescue protein Dom34